MIYKGPLDGTDLLDTDRDDSEFAKGGGVYYEDTTSLEHLEIRDTESIIPIAVLRLIPYNHPATGMDTFNGFAFEHRTIAGHMETMIIKDIKDNMRCFAIGENIAI